MEKNKKTKEEQELSAADIERMEILLKSKQKTGRQLTISAETGDLKEINELRELIGRAFENPDEKYNLYYKGIRKLLIDHLPKGEDYKEMREIIYDEKNIFLNLGKRKCDNNGIRKSDGRMTYQPVMNEILDIVVKWVADSQSPFDIYREFYELNERHGYGHEEYDTSVKAVAQAMLNISRGN
ncbi:hypothetical protein KTO58_05680 [Chitinophaga pendula]|uniref:hypothetical protein n=1 Tax=Chitinophaga TaxID=79328 RepID=UPI000BAF9477|nr:MULTISPECIES: hypothetical protein [Chitinophaga]ASZ13707.1 hypothetical protein CK934_23490 [Chitinophaga sp. MD30]UCJ08676.1 hypothetical protein KTO58_05680 [Chitinophaga pendula]